MNTFRKLTDGTWCIATDARDDVQPGSTITVTKRDGRTQQVTVAHVVRVQNTRFGIVRLFAIAEQPRPAAAPAETVGDLSGIFALFQRARQHLRFPAIVLNVPGYSDAMRISVAGQAAREPGSLTVTANEERVMGRRRWFGRVLTNGSFQPGRDVPAGVADQLRRFAANPVEVAAEHGRLTGRCCFCNHALEDERSTSVGYGPVCAEHYGLPWGTRPAAVAAPTPTWTELALAPRSPAAPPTHVNVEAPADLAARYAAAVVAGQLPDDPVTVAQMAARLAALVA